jgi:hypothetical protein
MEDQRFDDLTRSLANRVSRRQILKVLVASAVGGILIRSGGGDAFAEGGNSDCAHWCNEHFPPGPDRGECKSNAAHDTGLCHSPCGPDGSGGTLCGGPAYASTTCCATGSATPVCKSGVCAAACVTLSNGTCAKPCSGPSDCPGSGCFCQATPDGRFCAAPVGAPNCSVTSGCPKGSVCAGGFCHPVC